MVALSTNQSEWPRVAANGGRWRDVVAAWRSSHGLPHSSADAGGLDAAEAVRAARWAINAGLVAIDERLHDAEACLPWELHPVRDPMAEAIQAVARRLMAATCGSTPKKRSTTCGSTPNSNQMLLDFSAADRAEYERRDAGRVFDAQCGDAVAMQEVWAELYQSAVKMARKFTAKYRWIDPEDLAADVAIKLPKVIEHYRPKVAWRTYVSCTLYRRIQDALRQQDPLGIQIPVNSPYPAWRYLAEIIPESGGGEEIDSIILEGLHRIDRNQPCKLGERHD